MELTLGNLLRTSSDIKQITIWQHCEMYGKNMCVDVGTYDFTKEDGNLVLWECNIPLTAIIDYWYCTTMNTLIVTLKKEKKQ